MIKYFFTTILFLLLLHPGISQSNISLTFPDPPKKDYVLLKDSSMLIGAVQYDSIKSIIYFKASNQYYESGSNKFEIIENDAVVEFKNDKIKYVRKIWDGSEQFVVELIYGKVSLYNLYDDYFVQVGSQIIPLIRSSLKESLSKVYSSRCGWDFNSNYLQYTKVFLKHLVNGYNKDDCFKVQRKQIGIRLNLRNASNNLFIPTEQIDTDLDNSISAIFGLQMEIPTYKRATILISLDFMTQSLKEDFEVLSYTDIQMKTSHFILQAGPKYYFKKLFIEAGPTVAITSSGESLVASDVNEFPLDLAGLGIGLHYSFGYLISNELNRLASIEFRRTNFQGADLATKISSLGLYIGF